jgi:SAM-dependent methyltransferase
MAQRRLTGFALKGAVMKPYEEVIKERYDGREMNRHLVDNIYARINPIGYYGQRNIEHVIYRTLQYMMKNRHKDISTIKILDVGCGSGWVTRAFAEFTGNPANITGIDLSAIRIAIARSYTQSIRYIQGDIVKGYDFGTKFDLITAFDVFMHFHTEEIIIRALANIYNNLNPQGIFVWYDAYARDHFDCPVEAEGNGYNPRQMDVYAKRAGFKRESEFFFYRHLFGRHSLYLYNKIPVPLVKVLEKITPGYPGNIIKIYSPS